MTIHYYMLCFRFEALVASHLPPEDFGPYMAVGTQKNTQGNVLFFEVDPTLTSTFFPLEKVRATCVPHRDGSPKRSKYISTYRVLEHLDPSVLGTLYLTTADGRILGLESGEYDNSNETPGPNLFQELCPVSPMVVSSLSPRAFARFMTDPVNPVSVPRLFFTDMELERDTLGHLSGNLPYENPDHIIDCIRELGADTNKQTKTVARAPHLHGFFRTIRRGFYIGDQKMMKFYPFPDQEELEVRHHEWWHSATESLVV
ncbi:MAG TPA: hypothetical protein VK470_05760 [Bacteroidota bacterium]|nr:hypothetical protein [Bacteroidota bacterium]